MDPRRPSDRCFSITRPHWRRRLPAGQAVYAEEARRGPAPNVGRRAGVRRASAGGEDDDDDEQPTTRRRRRRRLLRLRRRANDAPGPGHTQHARTHARTGAACPDHPPSRSTVVGHGGPRNRRPDDRDQLNSV
eukprot:scaffold1068_cov375-Prasinococcus_capsulatus_cf.AAC.8